MLTKTFHCSFTLKDAATMSAETCPSISASPSTESAWISPPSGNASLKNGISPQAARMVPEKNVLIHERKNYPHLSDAGNSRPRYPMTLGISLLERTLTKPLLSFLITEDLIRHRRPPQFGLSWPPVPGEIDHLNLEQTDQPESKKCCVINLTFETNQSCEVWLIRQSTWVR